MHRPTGLKAMYYRSFLLLIVLPIVLVVAVVTVLFGQKLIADANETIDAMHTSVSTALRAEVQEASLGLAYFLLGNDQEVVNLLDQLPADRQERYNHTQHFKRIFDYMAVRDENIEALHLYLTDGTYYDLAAGLAAPVAQAQAEPVYQQALKEPNLVTVGSVSASLLQYTTNHPGDVLLCAALSVQEPRRPSALSVGCLYFSTSAEELIAEYNASVPAGRTFLVDGQKLLAGDQAAAQAAQASLLSQGEDLGGYDWYTLTQIPRTNLAILTLVDNDLVFSSYSLTLAAVLALLMAMFLLFVLYSRLFLKRIIQPVQALGEGMAHLQAGDFAYRIEPKGHQELIRLEENFNETSSRMAALILENQSREKEKYQEELKALQSEINPHFLLNTVNTIRFMAQLANFDSIRDMAASLMDILRCVLRNPNERYTLADEIRLLRSYISIMEIRRPGSFTVSYDLSGDSLDCRIPKLLLQPLVENAIQHAFPEVEAPGEIRVSSRLEKEQLVLQVSDNGVGIPPEILAAWQSQGSASSHAIGMANVRRRLELNCPGQCTMAVISHLDEGTLITLTLPANYLPKEDAT
ncbi:MAG: sensor histidine kinase [Clostridia bacterium]|nr:sensor histidine kinase [Clostridia bacterium]